MDRQQLLSKLDKAWADFEQSFAGLTDAQMVEPGVVGDWSVRDILGHVTTWEEEALKSLPLILEGRKPPKYSVLYGGIDAFNAQESGRRRGLPLVEVLSQLETTHGRLVSFVEGVAESQFAGESPFRHRLRLDTYSHYPLHARMIREWRAKAVGR
jgi:hypothetical protein